MLVRELGEEKLVARMLEIFAASGEGLEVPAGDDAAVIAPSGESSVWTADMLLEGVHFRRGWQSPEELGAKALAVNLSDLAAMGAKPAAALLSLAFPPDEEVETVLALCRGFAGAAAGFTVAVAGGDTCRSQSGLVLGVSAMGTVEEGAAVRRSGARPGDTIYVTGWPGRAAAALGLLEAGESGVAEDLRRALAAPQPRVSAGAALAAAGVTAMIDTSDGIAADLGRICRESGAGARIDKDTLPLDPQVEEAAERLGLEPLELVLQGGEDYELLFTASEKPETREAVDRIKKESLNVTAIGKVTEPEKGMVLAADGHEDTLSVKAFEHFK